MNFFQNFFGNNTNNNNNRNGRSSADSSRRERRQAPRQNVPSGQRNTNSTNNNRNANNTRPRRAQPHSTTSTSTSTQNQQQRHQQQQQQQQHFFHVPPGMEHIFAQIFSETTGFNPQDFQQQQQESSNAPPPASEKAIRTLPTVLVTPEDLVDENNRECCICFEPHNLRDKVTRLPCAHIFHPQCINEWLTKHCTCPICRYELPTTNPTYESSRQQRMAARKPRFASYELQRMKTPELIDLCTNKLRIPIVGGGYTKQEIIDLILASGKIDIISAPPPLSVKNISTLRGMGVGKLKRFMTDAGVFFDSRDVIEKEDMVQIFLNSGRIIFEEDEEEEDKKEQYYGNGARVEAEEEKEEIGTRQGEEVKRARIDEEGSCISTRSISNDNLKSDTLKSEFNDRQSDKNKKTAQVSNANENNNNVDDDINKGDDVMVEEVSATSSLEEEGNSLNDDAVSLVEGTPIAATEREPVAAPTASVSTNSRTTAYSYNESADISSRSIAELKQLGRALNVDLSNCLEKREMIQLIVNALSRSGVGTRYGGGVVS